jgi:hypothetical protein
VSRAQVVVTPASAVARETWQYLSQRRRELAAPAGLLFALTLAWSLYLRFGAPAGHAESAGTFGLIGPEFLMVLRHSFFSVALPNLAVIAVVLSTLVAIHRQVLLGEPTRWRALIWNPFTLRYFWLGFRLALVAGIIFAVTYILVGIGIGLVQRGLGLGSVVQALHSPSILKRFLVVELFQSTTVPGLLFLMWYLPGLPAAAIGEKEPVTIAAKATEGRWGWMVALSVCVLAPFWLARQLLMVAAWAASPSGGTPVWGPIDTGLYAALQTAEYCAAAVMLSLAYRHLAASPLQAAEASVTSTG